ncbi:transcriptional regulator [Salipaludibacillus neizhouensis]|uniref:Transcriptional regulator n=1 Tax=Salipaludibacillus neizhouensis TaxID=885475 RepID=A0A3A9K674_9BACI|nr:metalloregulator ArsR/SmtB family transcription factor [Salipaludibacillus neizhouensis]RKL66360.1 transcriptional regulator [Salipaludibacillus neizhouensis]
MSAEKHDVFQAIADPTRREVLRLLGEKELSITQISDHFPMTRTAVSKHLKILSEAKLVKSEKHGRAKIYYLHAESLQELKDWLEYFERFWENKLLKLKHQVEKDD